MHRSGATYISIIYFLGLSIISHFISRRSITNTTPWKGLKRNIASWPRLCVLVIFLDSWAFLFSSGFLTLAIGLEENVRVCAAAIYMCIAFYATSKVFIYLFLIEKVHIVWSPPSTPRFRSRIFIFCFIALMVYTIILLVNFFGRIHFISRDVCIIGLQHWSVLPLLSADIIINIVLTGLFLWPLKGKSKGKVNPNVKRLATRTFIASLIALTSSTANIAILSILQGKEPGWVCLACCSADVLINAFAIYWVTGLNHQGEHYSVTYSTYIGDGSGISSPPSTTCQSFTVTTSRTQHILSPISPARTAIGTVIYPRDVTLPGRDNAPCSVLTTETHAFQAGPMVFMNGMRVPPDGISECGRENDETDSSHSVAATLTCEDEIIGASCPEEVQDS